jgi:hypothetical protein
MANIKSLTGRVGALDTDRGYFQIEDTIYALQEAGDSWIEHLQRKCPFKTFNPALLQFFFSGRYQ